MPYYYKSMQKEKFSNARKKKINYKTKLFVYKLMYMRSQNKLMNF